MKNFLISIFVLSVVASASICYGHADTLEIKVIDFQILENGEYLIVFEAVDSREDGIRGKTMLRKYSVHVGYNPKHLALPVNKKEHTVAIKYFQTLLLKNKQIIIWRMSGQGYRPIKNNKGHYRTDAVKIVSYSKEEPGIIFVHSDDSFFATH